MGHQHEVLCNLMVPDKHLHPRLLRLFASAAVALILFTGAYGQDPAVTSATDAPPMTVEQAQAKLQEIQTATGMDETAKTDAVARWAEIVDTLRSGATFASQATDFQTQTDQAPQRTEEIQKALTASPVEAPPDAFSDATLAQLDQEVAKASADLDETRKKLAELEAEPTRRVARRKAIPDVMAQARQRLEEVRAQIQATPADAAAQPEAARTLLAAKQWSLAKEVGAYESELRYYDAASPLLTLQIDRAIRTVSMQEKLVKRLQDLILQRRQSDARQAATDARLARSRIAELPYVQEQAEQLREQNESMARQRTGPDGIIARTDATQEAVHAMEARVDSVTDDFTSVSERIDVAGLNNAVGMLLRKYLTDLPRLRVLRSNIRNREKAISDLQLDLIQLREERRAVADVEAAVAAVLEQLPGHATDEDRATVESVFRDLLRNKRDNLDALLSDTNTYFEALQNLDAAERELVTESAAFYSYIDERVLWIASGSPFGWEELREAWDGLRWLAMHDQWIALARVLVRSLRLYVFLYLLLAVVALLLAVMRRRLRAALTQFGAIASKRSNTSIRPTLDAAVLTLFMAIPLPFLLWVLGWSIGATPSDTEFSVGFGKGLQNAAAALLLAEFLRQLTRSEGLAEAHLAWPEVATGALRRHVAWLAAIVVPGVFSISLIAYGNYEESLGRIVFVAILGAITTFVWITLRPQGGAFQRIFENRRSRGYGRRLRSWWHLAGAALPLILIAVALAGYFYTAQRLAILFFFTVALTAGILFVYGLILRWLVLTRRALAMDQARKRLAALKARDADGDQPEMPSEEVEVDLAKVDVQTQRLVRSLLMLAFLVGLWLIWADTLPALNILNQIELPWTRTETVERTVMTEGRPVVQREDVEIPVTGVHVLAALIIAIMTVAATRNLPGLLEIAVLQRLSVAAGERYAITTVTRYVLATIGTVLAFQTVGIGWAKVQWLVAAVGLGLGFGLQEIFANFVSGLIILFERPIRVGDTVTVGGINGTVTRIRIRATTITDFDRKELIVPNKEFVTSQLVNWTLTTTTLRIVVPVGIAYGSDTRQAERILYELAHDHPDVMRDPAPEVWFTGFGDSTLNFELRVFAASLDTFLSIRHDMLMHIDDAFRKAHIEIAFPQRDIHVRSIEAVLPVAQRQSNPEVPETEDARKH